MRTIALIVTVCVSLLSACKTTEQSTAEALAKLQTAMLSSSTYADEARDWNIPATDEYRTKAYHSPTPNTIDEAHVITTPELLDMIQANRQPVLVDVLGGGSHATLPGSVWLSGAGIGEGLKDEMQGEFSAALDKLSGGHKQRPVVVYCLSSLCWLSHNAALRAIRLGYDVYWYRGGVEAWKAAALPTVTSVDGW